METVRSFNFRLISGVRPFVSSMDPRSGTNWDGRSYAGFLKSVGKTRAPDSNESLKPVDYDAKKIFCLR